MDGFLATGFGTAVLIAAQSLLIVAFVMISLLFLVYGDRKIWAAVQMRRGPNVVGPFDLPEAESELVAGFMVEYSSTPYLLFMAGEYIAIFLMCALISLLFFGGWLSPIPGLADGWWWMVAKMWLFFFMFAMVKAIVPRYRYDQLMRIGWKVFLPMSLAWVVIVAFLAKFEVLGGFWARWAVGG
jgi:NADH-quinone oxidoreductase subunit H